MSARVQVSGNGYRKLRARLEAEVGDAGQVEVEVVMRAVQEVFGLDPEASTYTAKTLERVRRWRAKKREERAAREAAEAGERI